MADSPSSELPQTPLEDKMDVDKLESTSVTQIPSVDKNSQTIQIIKEHLKQLEKSVNQQENRFTYRVLRSLNFTRKRLNSLILTKIISEVCPHNSDLKTELLNYLPNDMEIDPTEISLPVPKKMLSTILPENDAYIHLLVVLYLIDSGAFMDPNAKTCADSLSSKLVAYNRRSLDMLASKCYFYQSRIYELNNELSSLRGVLHARLRTCTLRHDEYGQAVILNLLLRNFILYKLFDQAAKLVSKTTFPINASNNETARYYYYVGRIRAIQLEYSESYECLIQAIRKAPQNTAIGFKQTVYKFAIVVQLLIGEIPDRAIFYDKHLQQPLLVYFTLVQLVRQGDLIKFSQYLEEHELKFQTDNTYTLIMRLRHNVIKTCIKMISVAYSRISLIDLAEKLGLESSEDAEFIAAKAIRDGVIEAMINHEEGFLKSKEISNLYLTDEPRLAFNKRISFCLEVRNEAVKAMRFPAKVSKDESKNEDDAYDDDDKNEEIDINDYVDDDDDDF